MITFQDNTIRDGMQQGGVHKNLRTRIQVVEQIKKLKDITSVEIGMCASLEDQRMLSYLIRHLGIGQNPVVLTRLNKGDIELTKTLTQERSGLIVKLLVPISVLHVTEKLGWTMLALEKEFQYCLELLENSGITIDVCLEDATRADRKILFKILEICTNYPVNYVTIADTTGCSTPFSYGKLINDIVSSKYPFKISVHCHNDLGLATANSYAGILSGATQIETTFLGIGERAGNTSIDEIAYLIHKLVGEKNIDISKIANVSLEMQKILGHKIPPNKALIGDNVFLHEAGIHQKGSLKNRKMYQFVMPEEIGRMESLNFGISGISSSEVIINKIKDITGTDQSAELILALYRKLSKVIKNITLEDAIDYYYLEKGGSLL